MNTTLFIVFSVLAFSGMVWLLIRQAKEEGRSELEKENLKDAVRIKNEQIKAEANKPTSYNDLIKRLSGDDY